MLDDREPGTPDIELKLVIMTAVIIGMILSVALIMFETDKENFSTLAVRPDYNYTEQTTSFLMDVQSSENRPTQYSADIFINGVPQENLQFSLNPGETYEARKILNLTTIQYPAKVLVEVKTPQKTYSAHYWLKQDS